MVSLCGNCRNRRPRPPSRIHFDKSSARARQRTKLPRSPQSGHSVLFASLCLPSLLSNGLAAGEHLQKFNSSGLIGSGNTLPDRPDGLWRGRVARDQIRWVAVQRVGAGLQEILAVGALAVLYPRNRRLGNAHPFSQLVLAQASVPPPLDYEMAPQFPCLFEACCHAVNVTSDVIRRRYRGTQQNLLTRVLRPTQHGRRD
jgi:hypothetical protein